MTTRLIIVGKNKGGVGGTFVSRLLSEYRDSSGWRIFDGQAPGGSLRRFRPEAEVVAFGTTAGRMRVLDSLSERTTFVDLPAGLLSETLQMLKDAGFLADVVAQRVKLTVVHVLGPNVDSVGEAADVAGRLADGGEHVLVRNAANDDRFQYDDDAYARLLAHVTPTASFDVPHLDGTAREAVDVSGLTFGAFCQDAGKSSFLRRLVGKWRDDCFGAMTKVNLGSNLS